MVKLARTLGRVAWTIDIPGPRAEPTATPEGPGRDSWKAMLAEAQGRAETRLGKHNLALVRLLHDNGPRRSEAVGLDLADVDLPAMTVAIVGKGRTERAPRSPAMTRPPTPWPAGSTPAATGRPPLRPPRRGGRDRPTGPDRRQLRRTGHPGLGRRAGVPRGTNPHGLRHEGVTRALDLTGGDVRKVQKFSRHAKVETLLKYDDNRHSEAG